MRKYLEGIKVIDTHEHQRQPGEFHFYRHLSYFHADVQTAGAPANIDSMIKITPHVDSLWRVYGEYINDGRATSYYDEWIRGFQLCYGLDKPYLSREDVSHLSLQMEEKYKNYPAWFNECFSRFNFQIMFLDPYWNQFNVAIDTVHFALVFRIDSAITGVVNAATTREITTPSLLNLLNKKEAIDVSSLDRYLEVMDTVLKIFVRHRVVCLKNALAYHRSISFSDVDNSTAEKIYASGIISETAKKQLEDFMFHWFIKKSIQYHLPVQIHTGYLAGLNGKLDDSHPMQLLPLIRQYPEACFVLFHGGYPWTGDFIVLGKEFPNVMLDMVWLCQLSRTAAIRTLHEILDAVPYNKICWGGDVTYIEQAVGSLSLAREVVATVLAERIEKGWLTEEVARDIGRKIFRENAIRIYRLEEKYGIKK